VIKVAWTIAGIDLGQVTREEFNKSMPIIMLPAVTGNTNNNTALALLGASRRISITGEKIFADLSSMESWLRSIEDLVVPVTTTSASYGSDYYNHPYATGSGYKCLVENFKHSKSGGEQIYVVSYQLDIVEASGAGD